VGSGSGPWLPPAGKGGRGMAPIQTCHASKGRRRSAGWLTPRGGSVVGLLAVGLVAGAGLLPAQEPKKAPPTFQIEPQPKGIVFAVAFSKNGQQLALACEDKTVALHDWKTGKQLALL